MTDRELLEAAAKAAGIAFNDKRSPTGNIALHCPREGWWNPLEDDAQALRLAVKLRIDVRQFDDFQETWGQRPFVTQTCVEPWRADPYAATRRAIVRAAAAIGDTNG